MFVVIVGVTALLTSILSAVAGLGGGVILLIAIAQFVAPTTAIPIQGAIQLASNSSRAWFLRDDVAWPPVGWSSLLLLPASLLGVAVATSLPEDAIRVVLAAFVLVLAWRPTILRWRGGRSLPPPALVGVGGLSGFVNTTVGASGPVTSPFFRAVTATHVAFVATAAVTQVLAHTAKLIAFTAEGWRIGDHLGVIAIGVAGVVVGSRIGTHLVGRMPERTLATLFQVVLTALALRLLATAIL
ncbi:MAG: sulfite exporter TauE/SafE family protein [Actinomycetota bacterium]